MKIIVNILAALALLIGVAPTASEAAGGAALRQAFDSMYDASLDVMTARRINSFVIRQANCNIFLDSGRIAFLEPVTIDSVRHHWAAYFEGDGRLQFSPPVRTEKDQLQRFYKSDSLDRSFSQALFLISDSLADLLDSSSVPSAKSLGHRASWGAHDRLRDLTHDENFFYVFGALTSLVTPTPKPFFVADIPLDDGGRTYYVYDPRSREEVQLLKRHWTVGYPDIMELVCSYHKGLDTTYAAINGVSHIPVRPLHYVTDGVIDRSGKYTGSAVMTAAVAEGPLQLIPLFLHKELKVDSVLNSDGSPVEFIRYEDDDHKSLPLYLILDRPVTDWDTLNLTFYYKGKIAKAELGIFNVTAGGQWYPHVAYQQQATFDMTFRTPGDYEFVATGTPVSRDTVRDTLVTRWRVDQPARNVSFGIGPVKRYEYTDSSGRPVDIYYSEDVHENAMWERFGYGSRTRNIQDQVARDVINSLALFSHRFGPYPYPRLSVTEIFSDHGEAFPGFIHLGMPTWYSTDRWGEQQRFRAHEVAHQWWGVGVGTETYHDRWLSEGFAEYSALLYIQSALGDDRFYSMIRDARDEIFSVRKYLFGMSGAEAGPIIMGARTQSTKTEGDLQLVIYKKGALVLHMLRWLLMDLNTLDDSRFNKMMADYYRTYVGKDASTADFERVVRKYAGEDMTWFFRQWVYGTELPTYRFEYSVDRGDNDTFVLRGKVTTEDVTKGFQMPVPVEIEYKDKRREYRRLLIDQPEMSFSITGLTERPKNVRFNPFEAVLAKVKQ